MEVVPFFSGGRAARNALRAVMRWLALLTIAHFTIGAKAFACRWALSQMHQD
jgi:hypothetical protein